MTKYRSKPEFIDAVQWNKLGDYPNVREDVSIGDRAWYKVPYTINGIPIYFGDYILTHSDGRIEVMNEEEFLNRYEEIKEKVCPSCLGSTIDTLDPCGDLTLCRICHGTGKIEE